VRECEGVFFVEVIVFVGYCFFVSVEWFGFLFEFRRIFLYKNRLILI
jgi:hypothetical protein